MILSFSSFFICDLDSVLRLVALGEWCLVVDRPLPCMHLNKVICSRFRASLALSNRLLSILESLYLASCELNLFLVFLMAALSLEVEPTLEPPISINEGLVHS